MIYSNNGKMIEAGVLPVQDGVSFESCLRDNDVVL